MDKSTASLAIGTAALVPTIYSSSLPSIATLRGTYDSAGIYATAEQYAAATSIMIVTGIGIMTREPAVVLIGVVAVLGVHASYTRARKATPPR